MRSRRRLAVPLVLLALLAPASAARANEAYDRISAAYAQGGGQLDSCAFTQADLQAAIRGIPPQIRKYVPALRRAMQDAVAAHERGDCKGVRPDERTTGGAQVGGAGSTTTVPPVTTPTVTTQTAPAVPTATATTPTTAQPTTPATQPAAATPHERDRTPLVIALIALGALVLLALLLWGLARMRGWDPPWAARMRHGWSEAGFRTTSTWSEFTDWLRLGR